MWHVQSLFSLINRSPRAATLMMRALTFQRFVDWSFKHYLTIAPPDFVSHGQAARGKWGSWTAPATKRSCWPRGVTPTPSRSSIAATHGRSRAILVRRTGDPEAAADLLAETFAAALTGLDRFDPARGDAAAWLYGIARHQLARRARHGAVEERARRRLGWSAWSCPTPTCARSRRVTTPTIALEGLPPDQRAAVHARVVQEQDYAQIAAASGSTEPAVRQRVSRGLATLRSRLAREEQR